MMDKQDLIEQTHFAFQHLQKLYFEISYLIKEVEGILGREKEEFIIGRPSGYGVSTNRSTGLESSNVDAWPMRKMAVFFIPKKATLEKNGTTNTKLDKNQKIIYLRIVIDTKGLSEPKVYAGILYEFYHKGNSSREKVEQLMTHLETREAQFFKNPYQINYEDGYVAFHGKLREVNLFDVNSSEEVYTKIVLPALDLFRGYQ
jgi:hypothetical protein